MSSMTEEENVAHMKISKAWDGEDVAGAGAGVSKPEQADCQQEHGVPSRACTDLPRPNHIPSGARVAI